MKILIPGAILISAALLPTLNQFPPPGSLLTAQHTWHAGFALILLGLAQLFREQMPDNLTKKQRLALSCMAATFIAWIAAHAYQDLQILITLPLLGYIYFFPEKK
jgi:hypothetical protein